METQSKLQKLDGDAETQSGLEKLDLDSDEPDIFSMHKCPQLPWLLMLTNSNVESFEEEESAPQFLSLSDNTIYSIRIPQIRHKHYCGSFMNAGGWLMTVDKHTVIRLVYPWGRRIIEEQLPPFLEEHVVKEYKKSFSLFESTVVRKAAMSDDGAFLIVINRLGKAFFLKRDHGVWKEFSHLPSNEVNTVVGSLEDVIYHKGHFYAVDHFGGVGVLRIDDAKLQPLETKGSKTDLDTLIRSYLVGDSTSDRLYLVERIGKLNDHANSGYETTCFKVYEIKKDEKRLEETVMVVQSLHDGVIFLGFNSSHHVMASKFTGKLRRNCIYFTDDTPLPFSYYRGKYNVTPDMGIFNMENKSVDRLVEERRSHPRFSMPLWIRAPPVRRPPLGASGASYSGKS